MTATTFLKTSTIRLYDMDGNDVATFHGDGFVDDNGAPLTMPALWAAYPTAVKLFEHTSRGNVRQTIWRREMEAAA